MTSDEVDSETVVASGTGRDTDALGTTGHPNHAHITVGGSVFSRATSIELDGRYDRR